MSDSFCEVPSVWRHICPNIYDLAVTCDLGKSYTVIDLPRDLRIQGATKPNDYIQSVFKLQGAFPCVAEIVQAPSLGTLELTGKGWIYTPILPHVKPSAIPPSVIIPPDIDTITFRMALNGEHSAEAQILITFT